MSDAPLLSRLTVDGVDRGAQAIASQMDGFRCLEASRRMTRKSVTIARQIHIFGLKKATLSSWRVDSIPRPITKEDKVRLRLFFFFFCALAVYVVCCMLYFCVSACEIETETETEIETTADVIIGESSTHEMCQVWIMVETAAMRSMPKRELLRLVSKGIDAPRFDDGHWPPTSTSDVNDPATLLGEAPLREAIDVETAEDATARSHVFGDNGGGSSTLPPTLVVEQLNTPGVDEKTFEETLTFLAQQEKSADRGAPLETPGVISAPIPRRASRDGGGFGNAAPSDVEVRDVSSSVVVDAGGDTPTLGQSSSHTSMGEGGGVATSVLPSEDYTAAMDAFVKM